MSNETFPRYEPGEILDAATVNRHSDLIERHDRAFSGQGTNYRQDSTGNQLYDPRLAPFWGKIRSKTGTPNNPVNPIAYTCFEQIQVVRGIFSNYTTEGREVTAYEANNTDCDVDTVVYLIPYNNGEYWEFSYCCGTSTTTSSTSSTTTSSTSSTSTSSTSSTSSTTTSSTTTSSTSSTTTSSTSTTTPVGAYQIGVLAIGGGGSGGGGEEPFNKYSGGGGGGASAIGIAAVVPGRQYLVFVGPGSSSQGDGGVSGFCDYLGPGNLGAVYVQADDGKHGLSHNDDPGLATGGGGGAAAACIGVVAHSGGAGAQASTDYGGGGGAAASVTPPADGGNASASNGGLSGGDGGRGGNGGIGDQPPAYNGSGGAVPGGGGGGHGPAGIAPIGGGGHGRVFLQGFFGTLEFNISTVWTAPTRP